MRKYTYVVLAAALALSACGNKNVTVDSETTTAVNESEETTAADMENKEDAGESKEEDSGAEQEQAYQQLQVGLSAEYEGEWDNQGPIITADCSTIQIQSDGNEQLEKTIEDYNEKNWQEVYSIYTENLEYAKEDLFPEGTQLSISRVIELGRADQQVLSFFNSEQSYLGGAHGNYYANGETFDSKTGEALELTDVVSDVDAVYEAVKKELGEQNEDNLLFEDYETTLHRMFYEADADGAMPLEWALTTEGLEFRFSPYVIGTFAAGTLEASIPYEGNEELFMDAYRCEIERPIREIAEGEAFYLDSDQDGTDEKVWFTTSWSEEDYNSTLVFHRTENDADEETFELDGIHGNCTDAYLMHTEEQVPYLYVEFLSENDWRHLEIFNLADPDSESGFSHKGSEACAVYGNFISDSSQFTLYTRLDILGTYTVAKNYAIGNDGMPVSDDLSYNIVNWSADWDHALKAERGIPVLMHVEGSEEKTEETLPKGTKFIPRKTDGETWVEMELEDGSTCEIRVERKNGEYIYSIDGISEYDYFSNLPYAG